ncbi:hypothetical protein [Sorangium sp. So ce385]|uniref:hypothetical protein n=1 Tax=Sorangium sp. So ce385 TaxID=3133308 RepID=UPI003F5AE899
MQSASQRVHPTAIFRGFGAGVADAHLRGAPGVVGAPTTVKLESPMAIRWVEAV